MLCILKLSQLTLTVICKEIMIACIKSYLYRKKRYSLNLQHTKKLYKYFKTPKYMQYLNKPLNVIRHRCRGSRH